MISVVAGVESPTNARGSTANVELPPIVKSPSRSGSFTPRRSTLVNNLLTTDDETIAAKRSSIIQATRHTTLSLPVNLSTKFIESAKPADMIVSFNSVFRETRHCLNYAFFCSVLGVVLSVVQREIDFKWQDRSATVIVDILRGIVSLSTLLLIHYIYKFYCVEYRFKQLSRGYLDKVTFWSTTTTVHFVAEVLISLIHEPPLLNVNVDMRLPPTEKLVVDAPVYVKNPWGLLICLRFYLIIRLVVNRYYTGGTKIVGLWHDFSFNIPFTSRNMLYSHPIRTLAPIMLIFCLTCAYGMAVCERGATDSVFTSFSTNLWLVLITMTAVGYGEIHPLTTCGRSISVLASCISILLTAVVVATMYQKLTLMPYESRMVEFLERASSHAHMKVLASNVMTNTYRYTLAKREVSRHPHSILLKYRRFRAYRCMFGAIDNFYTFRKQVAAFDSRYHNNQLFRAMLETIDEKCEAMLECAEVGTAEVSQIPPDQTTDYQPRRTISGPIPNIMPQLLEKKVMEAPQGPEKREKTLQKRRISVSGDMGRRQSAVMEAFQSRVSTVETAVNRVESKLDEFNDRIATVDLIQRQMNVISNALCDIKNSLAQNHRS